jgi:hypothetical protein
MRSPHLLPVLGVLALVACAGPAPQPGVSTAALGAVSPQPIGVAEAAVAARLGELGFSVDESLETGVITAEMANGAPAAWAECDRIQVTEQFDRNRVLWADAEDRRARVTVRFSELGGQTSVSLTPRLDGVYVDRFNNLPFDRPCASTGVMETQILDIFAAEAS